jgi:hypothetical protein
MMMMMIFENLIIFVSIVSYLLMAVMGSMAGKIFTTVIA